MNQDEGTPDSEELELPASEELEEGDDALDGEEVDPAEAGGGLAAEYLEYSHSGPMPGIPWFETVERLAPGSTEKVINDFTKEREHQRELQKQALRLDAENLRGFIAYQHLRLRIVALLAGFIAVAGVALILLDKEVYGLILLVGEIATMILAFFGRQRSDEDDAGSVDGA